MSHVQPRLAGFGVWAGAIGAPALLTVLLVHLGGSEKRDYVFLYLAIVVVLGVAGGTKAALFSAGLSFLMVDFYFVPPLYTFTIADEQDIVNLFAFVVTAVVVGVLASRRRQALIEARGLTQQLREVNAELARLNREQAEASQSALRLARSEQQIRTLQDADRARRELLANVSHELRTPLGTILTQATDQSVARLAGETGRRFHTIAAEARRLKTLVDDLLDMARIEGDALELDLEPVGLADAIEAAQDRLHRNSPRRRLHWDRNAAAVEVFADWNRLGQVLDNLLSNANRFGPPGTPLWLEARPRGDGLVEIAVSDEGPGVEAELAEHIFERFVRSDTEAEVSTGGSGLGLAIVKGLVEAHAGTVSLDARGEHGGATFRFTLPEAPES